MTEHDLLRILTAIARRSGRTRLTPSEDFLTLLREFVVAGDLTKVPEAARLYQAAFPTAMAFVAAKLPGLLMANYKPFEDAGASTKAVAWAASNPDWSNQVSGNIMSNRLPAIVDQFVVSLGAFQPIAPGRSAAGIS